MNFLVLFFSFLFYLILISGESKYSNLSICLPYQACRGQVKIFHILDNSIENISLKGDSDVEGSGEGSGESFPLYDESVEPLTKFNYDGSSEVNDTPICRCPETEDTDEGYEDTCNYDDKSKVMNIDKSIQLSFCKPIEELYPLECFGRRNVLRVIGEIHESGETLNSVADSVIFCHCKSETFKRIDIEPCYTNSNTVKKLNSQQS
ncbi:Hypothetical protein SRAE_2000115600 [Strongyloides ratti]|uniref:Uncharacterized protein n=1 Tax=Strongyloides ratti TaxID=34506 RepID=A0A090LEB6_STRRB|nr:Hypothetical protein SRAE_2000115600 [Strongyloides ratti]CEF66488.1 Hypothetical protein SRAE_2000115600 [Strongyloides ratti]